MINWSQCRRCLPSTDSSSNIWIRDLWHYCRGSCGCGCWSIRSPYDMKLANSISQRNLLSLGYGSGVLLVPINCPSWWLEDTILTGISAMTAGSRGDEDQLCCRAPYISCISKSIDVGENNSYIVAGTCLWLDVIRIVQDYGRIVEFWCKLSDEWSKLEIWSQGCIRINSEITFC